MFSSLPASFYPRLLSMLLHLSLRAAAAPRYPAHTAPGSAAPACSLQAPRLRVRGCTHVCVCTYVHAHALTQMVTGRR